MKQASIIQKRMAILFVGMALYFFALIIRLGYLQMINSEELVDRAQSLWSRNLPIEGQRGIIFDRNHQVLVDNVVAPSVIVIPRQVTDIQETATVLATVLGTSVEDMMEHVTRRVSVERIQPEGRKLSLDQVRAIEEADLDGVYLVNDVKRYYPHGMMLAHTLGFTGIDNQGLTGLEALYNEYLMGTSGAWKYFSDAKGNALERFSDLYTPASRGMDMELTIDARIQEVIEREADNVLAKYNPDQVMILAMDPRTGAILGNTSRPTFDPANYQDYDQEIFNRNLPIWSTFEPGSTFKIITYAATLEEGLMELDDQFNCQGYAMIEGTRIRDWKVGGHGTLTMLEVIMNSCNPGFMHMGVELLGKEKLFEYIEAFGFREKTGIDMLGESRGLVFNPDLIGPVEVATSAFGQGNSMTPIQLVTAVSAAVNGGNLMTPYVVNRILHPYTGEILFERQPEIRKRVLSEETSMTMRYVLENVGARGSGRNAFIEGYRVGGKTGTAQKPSPTGGYIAGEYILSFIGVAPMNDPQIVLYIAIDNPRNTIQYGGVVAAPVARDILAEVLPHLGVRPCKDQIPREYRWLDAKYVEVPNFIGMERREIDQYGPYRIEFSGSGSRVIAQQPEAGSRVIEGGTIRLYLGS